MNSLYYKSSGKFSVLSFFYLAAAYLIAAPLLAFLYVYATWYIPIIYINLLVVLGFGFLIGLGIDYLAIKPGKVRNTAVAILFSVIAALASLYFQWCIWLDLVANAGETYGTSKIGVTLSSTSFSNLFSLALQPQSVWQMIGWINESGTWGISGETVNGLFLYIVWAIEALIILILPIIIVYSSSKRPFFEKIDKWAKEKVLLPLTFVEQVDEFKAFLERNDFSILQTLKPVSAEVAKIEKHSVFSLFYYPDHTEYYLSVTNKTPKIDSKGKVSVTDEAVFSNLSIDSKMGEMLKALQG